MADLSSENVNWHLSQLMVLEYDCALFTDRSEASRWYMTVAALTMPPVAENIIFYCMYCIVFYVVLPALPTFIVSHVHMTTSVYTNAVGCCIQNNDALPTPLYKESVKVFKRFLTKVYCGTLSLVEQEREKRTIL